MLQINHKITLFISLYRLYTNSNLPRLSCVLFLYITRCFAELHSDPDLAVGYTYNVHNHKFNRTIKANVYLHDNNYQLNTITASQLHWKFPAFIIIYYAYSVCLTFTL